MRIARFFRPGGFRYAICNATERKRTNDAHGYLRDAYHVGRRPRRPEMELNRGFCDFCLFPERVHFGDAKHSYLIELKHAAPDSTQAELDAQYRDALEKLAKYRADPFVPSLARGTTLHQIVYQFKGDDPIRIEQIAEEAM